MPDAVLLVLKLDDLETLLGGVFVVFEGLHLLRCQDRVALGHRCIVGSRQGHMGSLAGSCWFGVGCPKA